MLHQILINIIIFIQSTELQFVAISLMSEYVLYKIPLRPERKQL